jgi:hypothetical protein
MLVNANCTEEKTWKNKKISSSEDTFLTGLSTGLKNPSEKGK